MCHNVDERRKWAERLIELELRVSTRVQGREKRNTMRILVKHSIPDWCSPVGWGPSINFGAPPHLSCNFNKVLGGPPLANTCHQQHLATGHAHVPPPIKKGAPPQRHPKVSSSLGWDVVACSHQVGGEPHH